MRRYNCESCGEYLRVDDIVYVHWRSDLFFCSRECEAESEKTEGEEYVLSSDDFEQ
jgi:hypothetical protein